MGVDLQRIERQPWVIKYTYQFSNCKSSLVILLKVACDSIPLRTSFYLNPNFCNSEDFNDFTCNFHSEL